MARILHKRSSTTGVTPAATEIDLGEMAVNTADGKVFIKKTNGTVVEVGGGGSGTVTSVAAGTGLSGGTITATGTLAIDFATSGTSSASKAVRADDSRLSDLGSADAHVRNSCADHQAIRDLQGLWRLGLHDDDHAGPRGGSDQALSGGLAFLVHGGRDFSSRDNGSGGGKRQGRTVRSRLKWSPKRSSRPVDGGAIGFDYGRKNHHRAVLHDPGQHRLLAWHSSWRGIRDREGASRGLPDAASRQPSGDGQLHIGGHFSRLRIRLTDHHG